MFLPVSVWVWESVCEFPFYDKLRFNEAIQGKKRSEIGLAKNGENLIN